MSNNYFSPKYFSANIPKLSESDGTLVYYFDGSGSVIVSGVASAELVAVSVYNYVGEGRFELNGQATSQFVAGQSVYDFAGSGSIELSGAASSSFESQNKLPAAGNASNRKRRRVWVGLEDLAPLTQDFVYYGAGSVLIHGSAETEFDPTVVQIFEFKTRGTKRTTGKASFEKFDFIDHVRKTDDDELLLWA